MQNAQLRRQTVPQQAQQAPRPQAEATTRPQQWLKASPRPQQWLLIGVPGCRLTGLKRSKRSKPSKSPPSSAHSRMQNAQLRRQKVPQQAQQAPRRSKRSKPSKSPPSFAGKRYPNKPNTRHSRLKRSKRSKPSTCPPSSAGKRVGGTRALAHSIFSRYPESRMHVYGLVRNIIATTSNKSELAREHALAALAASVVRSEATPKAPGRDKKTSTPMKKLLCFANFATVQFAVFFETNPDSF